jgi:hypothetical protein
VKGAERLADLDAQPIADEGADELPPIDTLIDMLTDAVRVVEAVDDLLSEHRHAAEDFPTRGRLAHAQTRVNEAWLHLRRTIWVLQDHS